MRAFIPIAKALSDENRVRVLMSLRQGELCVCQIMELLDLAPSTVSKHMAVLYQAGLVDARKDGRWMYYKLPESDAPPAVRDALAWTHAALTDSKQVADDNKRLRQVRKMDKAILCERYRGHTTEE